MTKSDSKSLVDELQAYKFSQYILVYLCYLNFYGFIELLILF